MEDFFFCRDGAVVEVFAVVTDVLVATVETEALSTEWEVLRLPMLSLKVGDFFPGSSPYVGVVGPTTALRNESSCGRFIRFFFCGLSFEEILDGDGS